MKHARAPSYPSHSYKRAKSLPTIASSIPPPSLQSFSDASMLAWIAAGKCALALNCDHRAVVCFEQALKYNRLNPEAVCGLAKVLRSHNADISPNTSAASTIEALEKIISYTRTNSSNCRESDLEVYMELCESFLAFQKLSEAEIMVNEALTRFPKSAKLHLLRATALSLRQDAASPEITSQTILSLKQCIQSLSTQPKESTKAELDIAKQAYIQLANYEAQSENLAAATQWLECALALPWSLVEHRQHASTWCGLASLYQTAGDLKQAKEVCVAGGTTLGVVSPLLVTYQAYLSITMGYQDLTQVEPNHRNPSSSESISWAHEALDTLAQIVDFEHEVLYSEAGKNVDDCDFLPWLLLGKAYEMLHEYRHAYAMYHIANKRKQGNQLTWLAIGKMYMEIGQLLDSETAYSKALDHFHPEDFMCLAVAWDGLTCIYERLAKQDTESAESWYIKLLEACIRAVECYSAIGDRTNEVFFKNRHTQLLKARPDENNDQFPLLRSPPDLPLTLLRRIVTIHPELRQPFLADKLLAKDFKQEQRTQRLIHESAAAAIVAPASAMNSQPTPSRSATQKMHINGAGSTQQLGQLTPRQSLSHSGSMLPANKVNRPQALPRPASQMSNSSAHLAASALPELVSKAPYIQHPGAPSAHTQLQYQVVGYAPYPVPQTLPSGYAAPFFSQPGMMQPPINRAPLPSNVGHAQAVPHPGYAMNGQQLYGHPETSAKPVYGPQGPHPGYAYYPQPGPPFSVPQMPYQYPAWYR